MAVVSHAFSGSPGCAVLYAARNGLRHTKRTEDADPALHWTSFCDFRRFAADRVWLAPPKRFGILKWDNYLHRVPKMAEDPFARERNFPTTRWSLIARAQDLDPELRRTALEELVRRYSPALRGYLVLCKRLDPERAEDVLQGFLGDRILQRDFFGHVQPERGKFRQLLQRSLHHYLIDRIRQERARGTRAGTQVDIAPEELAAGEESSPDVFDVAWARQVIVESVRRMHADCRARGRMHVWGIFEHRILLPTLANRPLPPYDQLVGRFGFESPEQASNALITAKRQFKRTIETVLGEYVETQEEIQDEIRDLHQILASAGPLGLDLPSAFAFLHGVTGLPDESSRCLDQTTPQSLAEMLVLGEEKDHLWEAEDLGDLLRHQLSQPLGALLPDTRGPSPTAARDACHSAEFPLETFQDLLRHPQPPLELLEAAKRWARENAKDEQNAVPAEISTVLYLASIAAALVHHHRRITKSDDDVVRYGFKLMLERPWLDEAIRDLLQQALTCLDHGQARQSPDG